MTAHKRRGRPRTFDRQAALESAMPLFWRHGYEGTSIADLTDAMGITPPTLYAAFGSKEQLYREVLALYMSRGEQVRQREIGEVGTAYELLEAFLYRTAERFTDRSKPAGCMVQTASLYCAAENEPARQAAASMRAEAFRLLVATLQRAQERQELPADTDIQALARFYNAIVQGMSVQAIDGASSLELQKVVELALAAWPGKRPDRVSAAEE